MNRSSLLALCFLVCTGLALACDWVQSIDLEQGLTFVAAAEVWREAALRVTEVSDPESCLVQCCSQEDCDLALVSLDGRPQCLLVNCTKNRELCDLKSSTQFKVYRKNGKREEGGEKLRVVPLMVFHKTNETNTIRCRLPMKVGSCRASFPKFYYDVTNQSCRSFIYGGCDANANNFESQEECEVTCRGVSGSVHPDELIPAAPERPAKAPRMALNFQSNVSQDEKVPVKSEPAATESAPTQETEMSAADFAERCGAEPQVGPCRAAFQHWYYNSETGSCQSFIYGGCRGNKNNYISKESCMAACTVKVLPSSKKVTADDEVSTEYKDGCMATSDPGPCRAAFPMFYYDPNTGTCQSFIYGGCRGNQNRYGTVEECMSHCSRDGSFDTRGKTRERWTAAVFLFVTLAAISVLLLVTLVVITLRRHNLPRRPSSISDKQELLPDPDEQSSLDSLTVPESPQPDKA